MKDKLEEIFDLRESFMHLIKEKYPDTYPEWPLNIAEKDSQVTLRETALKGVEEMFEALGHLKNWKPHRDTDIPDVNKDEFLEEIVDSFNYFFSLIILCASKRSCSISNSLFLKRFTTSSTLFSVSLKYHSWLPLS